MFSCVRDFLPCWQIVFPQTRICPRKLHTFFSDFKIKKGNPIENTRPGLIVINIKGKCYWVNFTLPAD